MTLPKPVRVVGVGSPQGDDAVAWDVVRQLQAIPGDGVEFFQVDGGQRLLEILDGSGSLILIDAMSSGAETATIRRLEWPDSNLEVMRPGSTHDMNPGQALRLADTLGLVAERIIIFGIEARQFSPSAELSAEISAAIPELIRQIAKELGDV
jgi:hydrogenase maturation protease